MSVPTEKQIQDNIWYGHFSSGNLIAVPCTSVFGWEADMVVVTASLFAHEFEIKRTRQDFDKDGDKDKFKHFEMWMNGKRNYKQTVGNFTMQFDSHVLQPPNYFWYVCPESIIKIESIPAWAGLAYLTNHGLRVVQKPKRLHREKLSMKHLIQLCRSANFRYWMARMNGKISNSD